MSTLKELYNNEIASKLKQQLALDNVMQVPRITKITINMGVGEAIGDKKSLESAISDLEKISGQKVVATKARKSIAGFKVREDWPIGCKVTLRRERMYEFLDRFITASLPRVRDFQGIKADGFDGRGNYNMGITEQIIFPEIEIDKVNRISGMDITFVTSADTDKEAKSLLTQLGLPFKKN